MSILGQSKLARGSQECRQECMYEIEERADQEAAHALRRQRTRQHPASGRPSAHEDRLYGRRLDTPLLEPPGFLLLNYGRQTLLGTIIAHIAHGAIVGGFASLSG
jgi:hypothetical protein